MDENNFKSTFKETYKGEVEEPVDKIYFRRRDRSGDPAGSRWCESYERFKPDMGNV